MSRFGEWFGNLKQQEIMTKQAAIDLQKEHEQLQKSATQKPDMSFWLVQKGGIQLPQTMLHLEALYSFAKAEPITRKTIETVRDEILRRGWEIISKFKRKCTNPSCQKEFEIELDVCDEPECGYPTRPPDYTQRANILEAKEFFKQVNKNDQSLMELMREVELDLEIVDDLWIILIKEYELDLMGNIFSSNIMELVRGNPMQMKLVTDEKGTLGGFYWMCLEHREFVSQNIQDTCSHCGRALHEVKYVCTKGSSDIDAQYYFVDGEVIHTSKYSPSALYGFSPINTLWEHAFALIKMVNYIRLSYEEKRIPSGALAVPTHSRESFRKMMQEWDQIRAMNPTALVWFTFNPETGGGKPEFLKFTDTLEEMQFVDVRNEFADRVSYYYGVSRVFTRSSAAGEGSGLGNEGLDVTITHKAMESGQSVWNEQVFPVLMEEFGITDFKQVLKHPSEEKEMQEIERKKAKAELAEIMQRLNYDAILEGEDWKFVKREEQPYQWGNGSPLAQTPPLFDASGYVTPTTDWDMSSDYQTDATEQYGVQYPESAVGECPPGEHKHPGHTKCHDETSLHEEDSYKTLTKGSELESFLLNVYEDEMGTLNVKATLTKEDFTTGLIDKVQQMITRMANGTKMILSKLFHRSMNQAYPKSEFADTDRDVLDRLLRSSLLWKGYDGMGESISNKVNEIITEADELGLLDWQDLVDKMQLESAIKQIVQDETYRLERIARTESHYLRTKGVEHGYRKRDAILGPRNYMWIGPDDTRTSEICKEIKQRVHNEGKGLGVPMDQLKQIITEVSKKHAPAMQTRDWQPHINCRHTIRGTLRRSS